VLTGTSESHAERYCPAPAPRIGCPLAAGARGWAPASRGDQLGSSTLPHQEETFENARWTSGVSIRSCTRNHRGKAITAMHTRVRTQLNSVCASLQALCATTNAIRASRSPLHRLPAQPLPGLDEKGKREDTQPKRQGITWGSWRVSWRGSWRGTGVCVWGETYDRVCVWRTVGCICELIVNRGMS